VSQISPFATIAGTRGVNDRTATNVVQIVIAGTAFVWLALNRVSSAKPH
jgi:hypothetical protein